MASRTQWEIRTDDARDILGTGSGTVPDVLDQGPTPTQTSAKTAGDAAIKTDRSGMFRDIADVVKGKLVAVPRGVMAAAAVMQGSRGGVDLPERDIDRVRKHLARYYAKMEDTAPWDE